MDPVSIVLISVLGALLLIVIVVLIIFLFRGRSKGGESSEVSNLSLKHDIEKSTTEQINQLSEKLTGQLNTIKDELKDQNTKAAEKNVQDLTSFKESVSKSITDQIGSMDDKVEKRLKESFESTAQTMTKVTASLQQINDTQASLNNMSKDVISLKNVLEGSQSRGAYGERRLESILAGVLGENSKLYDTQYDLTLDSGDNVRPDAVLFLPNDLILCIDSKFPLKHYQEYLEATGEPEKKSALDLFDKDVKDKIDEISSKYIIDGKTYPQALMFVPSDAVYAYLNSEDSSIWDYATKNHVSLVCPCTIGPVLTGIMMLKTEQIRNENAQRIAEDLNELSQGFEDFKKAWVPVSKKIGGLNKSKGTLNTQVRELTISFNEINKSNKYLLSGKEPIPNEIDSGNVPSISFDDDDDFDFGDTEDDDENDE